MILENDVEFAVGYSEPNAGSDAASMKLKAVPHTQGGQTGWLLNGQKTWTTSAHFAEWYWLGTRTDPDNKHHGITLMLVPLDHPNIEIRGIWTMGDERTNEVFIDNVFVPDEFVVGQVNSGLSSTSARRSTSSASPCSPSRPSSQRLDVLTDYVRTETRDGSLLKDDPVVRARMARLHTDAEVARVMGLKVVHESVKGERTHQGHRREGVTAHGRVLRVQAVRHRVLEAAGRRLHGHGRSRHASCGCAPRTRPWQGRAESTYRYTVIDTIGGGASEIQKNIIARRGLGLPKNF